MVTYQISHKLRIHHPFFNGERCLLAVRPTAETHRLLERHRLAWKQQGPCEWILAAPVGDPRMPGQTLSLKFGLRPLSALFHYVTPPGATVRGAGMSSLRHVGAAGIWGSWELEFDPESDAQTTEINLQSVERYWEYLVVPATRRDGVPLRIREDTGALEFEQAERVMLDGKQQALRFVSTVPIALQEKYPFRVKLWEGEEGAEQLLRHLESPAAASTSLYKPDTITQYCNC